MKVFHYRTVADDERHEYDLNEVKEAAAQARKLAIYDRATGLFAYWYLQLRATEELSRAQRHTKKLVCSSIWAPSQLLIDDVCTRLRADLRDHDLAAYLYNGHFVLLLTDTDAAGAGIVLKRLLSDIPEISAGEACFPEDGSTFDQLLECAKSRAGGPLGAPEGAA